MDVGTDIVTAPSVVYVYVCWLKNLNVPSRMADRKFLRYRLPFGTSFIRSFIHSFTHAFVHAFMRSFVHSFRPVV